MQPLKKPDVNDQPPLNNHASRKDWQSYREFEKGQIVALKEKYLSFSEIGRMLSRPNSTVLSFYNQFAKRGDVGNLPMPGRQKNY